MGKYFEANLKMSFFPLVAPPKLMTRRKSKWITDMQEKGKVYNKKKVNVIS